MGMLFGLTVFFIPGIGPLVFAGPLVHLESVHEIKKGGDTDGCPTLDSLYAIH